MSNIMRQGVKMPENAGEMQAAGRFKKGHSGNPRGKAKGTKNRATLIAQQLLEGELETICRRLILEATSGNLQAIKMILDRVLPPKKEHPITISLPKLQNSSDALQAMTSITEAVGNGDISPCEGEALAKIIDINVRAIEVHDFENRLNKLEDGAKQ